MGHLMRYLAVPLLAITLACGATATPASTRTISLTDQNAGQTVQARSGDTVKVGLQEGSPVPGSSLTWSVTSGAPSILRGVAVDRTTPVTSGPSRQDTYTATFEAAS